MEVGLLLCLFGPESSKMIFRRSTFRQNVIEDCEDIDQFCLTLSEYADVIGIRKPSHQYLTTEAT